MKRVYKENRRKEKPDDISISKIHIVYVCLLTYICDTISLNNRTTIAQWFLTGMTS